MTRRTVRKLTCWSDEEWRRVEDAARPSGVPPLRFVREAALEKAGKGAAPPPRRRRSALAILVSGVLARRRVRVRAGLVQRLHEAYRETGAPLPGWIEEEILARRYRPPAATPADQDGGGQEADAAAAESPVVSKRREAARRPGETRPE